MNIIRATVDDIPRIMSDARDFCSLLPDCQLNEKSYSEFWTRVIGDGSGVIFLLLFGELPVGAIGGLSHPDPITGYNEAVEMFWYVKPAFRTGLSSIRLMHKFESWAKEKGCRHVSMIFMESSMPAELKKFYEKLGYSLLETVYRKDVCQ